LTYRADNLHATADQQIGAAIEILSAADDDALRRPCPGREKLGDGTVGAIAAHTAENYQRIGMFLATSRRAVARHARGPGRHRIPGLLRTLGHSPVDHGQHGPANHDDGYSAESASLPELIERLTAAREQLASIAGLSDADLDAVPPKDSFRFCDGQRTLEQVLAGLLKHQDHQVQTIKAALAGAQ
jgi:hypothetical protein